MKISMAILSLLTASLLLASDQLNKPKFKYDMANAYFSSSSITNAQEQDALIKKTEADISWSEANKFIYDESTYLTGKAVISDPENKYSKIISPKIPDYKKALELLSRSVTISNNPVSAFEGSSILKTHIGLNNKEMLDLYEKFSYTLYKNKNCEGYVNYGDLQKDKTKALQVYNEGLIVCNKIKPYSFILGSKIVKTKADLNKGK